MPRKRLRFPNGIPRQEVKLTSDDDLTSDTLRSGMSDKSPLSNIDLRDRIVNAIKQLEEYQGRSSYEELADAVIDVVVVCTHRWDTGDSTDPGYCHCIRWADHDGAHHCCCGATDD